MEYLRAHKLKAISGDIAIQNGVTLLDGVLTNIDHDNICTNNVDDITIQQVTQGNIEVYDDSDVLLSGNDMWIKYTNAQNYWVEVV